MALPSPESSRFNPNAVQQYVSEAQEDEKLATRSGFARLYSPWIQGMGGPKETPDKRKRDNDLREDNGNKRRQ